MTRRSIRWVWELAFAVSLIAVFAYASVTAFGLPEGANLFPASIAVPSFVLSVLLAVLSFRARRTVSAPQSPETGAEEAISPGERLRRTGQIAAWILGMFAAVYLLGFLVAIPLSAVAYLRLAAREGWVPSVGIAAVCWALVFGVFDRLLHVPLPAGELLRVFGIR